MRRLNLVKYMGRLLLLLLFAGLLVCKPLQMQAASSQSSKVLKVGFTKDYGVSTDSGGGHSGYVVDYLEEIAKYTGWQYEYVQCDWNEGLELLETGEIDIFGPMQYSKEREKIYEFPDQQMGVEYGALYIAEGSKNIYYNDVESIDGMKIATVEGNFYDQRLNEYCDENNISIEYVVTKAEHYEEGLKNGEFDAILTGSVLEIPGTVLAVKLSSDPFYFATSKGKTDIIENMNVAAKEIFTNDAYFEAKLFEKYYGNKPISMPAFTRDEVAYLEKNQELRVALNQKWAPVIYYNEDTKEYGGAGIDLLSEIAEDLGIHLTYYPAESYEETMEWMQLGEVDATLGFDQKQGTRGVQYTNSFLEIPMIVVGSHSINLSEINSVGIYNQQTRITEQLQKNYPDFEFQEYRSYESLISALEKGVEDYIALNYYMFEEFNWENPSNTYRMVMTDVNFYLKIGVSQESDPLILGILNKAIQRISSEKVSEITFSNALSRQDKVPLKRIFQEYSQLILVGLLLMFLVILAFITCNNHMAKRKLKKIAFEDSLTGLRNIEKMKIDAGVLLKDAIQGEYTILYVDIDNFKYINETFGYDIGNKILQEAASYFNTMEDYNALISRMNADNFVLMVKTENLSKILLLFEQEEMMASKIGSSIPDNYRITFSVGYYCIMTPDEEFSIILDKANTARKLGKNQLGNISEYTSNLDKEITWRKEVTLSMDASLKKGEFMPYFQPKYDLKTGELIGAEALIRWQHEKYGLLTPGRFISYFEANGFIRKTDYYVLEQVCDYLKKWEEKGYKIVPISVNISRNHMYNPMLVSDLKAILKQRQIESEIIEIELTESFVFNNVDKMLEIMKAIKEAGFMISIDDFGSGYSSLNQLSEFPADILKIDKGFIDRITISRKAAAVVKKIIELAKELSMVTVAEGIETQDQAAILQEMGCDIAQGYVYGKPMPAEDFAKLLESEKRIDLI